MFLRRVVYLYLVALAFTACDKQPAILPPEDQIPAWTEPSPIPATSEFAVHSTPTPPLPPLAPPLAPELTVQGHQMIIEWEVDRPGKDSRPEWPKGASGVTIGIGYDLGYSSRAVILDDWSMVPQRDRLANQAGITGERAHQRLQDVHDILIKWDNALHVFDKIDVGREFARCRRAYRGFDDLRPNAQAALVSLGFNRGYAFNGPNRTEMRLIRDNGVPKQDYAYIAQQLRKMIRVWIGTKIEKGMRNRRNAEADLVLES